MKKITSLILVIVLALSAFALTSCEDINAKSEGVMTWAQYDAANLGAEVVIEGYIQGVQAWDSQWNNITLYIQDGDGAYFVYRMPCTEEDAAKLLPGVKVRITGYKAAWKGEVEIIDATYELCDSNRKYTAKAKDVTELLGTDELIKYQNMLVKFKKMTVVSVEYKGGQPGDDIYVTFEKNGTEYEFCVESALTNSETKVYKAVGELKAGDVVTVEGFLYWYEGANTHITAIK